MVKWHIRVNTSLWYEFVKGYFKYILLEGNICSEKLLFGYQLFVNYLICYHKSFISWFIFYFYILDPQTALEIHWSLPVTPLFCIHTILTAFKPLHDLYSNFKHVFVSLFAFFWKKIIVTLHNRLNLKKIFIFQNRYTFETT